MQILQVTPRWRLKMLASIAIEGSGLFTVYYFLKGSKLSLMISLTLVTHFFPEFLVMDGLITYVNKKIGILFSY